MTFHPSMIATEIPAQSASSFRAWQRDTFARGILPVIGITGGRGKSTVIRMLEAIFSQAHLRTATWTDLGIEIRGRRQRGEISGWSTALSRLSEGTIDVAIQELHWSTINAIGLPAGSYPVVGITNTSADVDTDGANGDDPAIRAALKAMQAAHADGCLVVNGEAYPLIDRLNLVPTRALLAAHSIDAPGLRRHLAHGGSGAWIHDKVMVIGTESQTRRILPVHAIPSSLGGAAQFEISSALIAASIGAAVGIDLKTVADGLRTFQSDDVQLPGSFNVYDMHGYRAVVDSIAPSSHLKTVLRAINPGNRRRQIAVIGDLSQLPEADIHEVGRLLGRSPGAIIVHSNEEHDLIQQFRKGIAANDYPPLVVYLTTERRALNRALKTVRTDDVMLVLTGDDPGPANRMLKRTMQRAMRPDGVDTDA